MQVAAVLPRAWGLARKYGCWSSALQLVYEAGRASIVARVRQDWRWRLSARLAFQPLLQAPRAIVMYFASSSKPVRKPAVAALWA